LEHHSANQFFDGRNRPQFCSTETVSKLLVKMITASPIARCSSFKFHGADAAFRILDAELRTVLSATTMFEDKPHRLNGRTNSVQRFCVLTI
jgi:hypothetical protein